MGDSKTQPRDRFEHYRVVTDLEGRPVKLGEGAMGVTYLAEDTNLRVKVALKVIAPNLLGDTEVVQRFQREAQAAARLRHPNVAAVYHLGEVDDTFFYTMEFVEGRTLREHVAQNGPLTVKQALEVTLQMCEALGAAERHQMVHRDIKPANIMLETTDDGLHAKLIDFGLAKPLQHDAQQTSALLTQRGTFLGTAVFASPEQVQDLPLDTRSDFYALGLTLWFMLEGRPPFEGSLHKVLYDQVHSKPPVERLAWTSTEVRTLIEKLLEKQPAARPQNARELRQMIHDCLRASAITSTNLSDWQMRYQVREAPRPQPWGSTYEGQDTLSGAVCLHFLRKDRFGDAAALERIIADVRRAADIQHPNVLRHVTVFPTNDDKGAGWMIVTEHPGSQTLLTHLQKVKQLPAEEALPLITRLGEALDCCLANGLVTAELDAARIFLKPQAPAVEDAPVEVLPKLCPISYRHLVIPQSEEDTALGHTQVVPPSEARNAEEAVQRLAMLAYQCLGGASGRLQRYIPLPSLNQRQNETLRLALTEKPFARAADLLAALQQNKPSPRPAPTVTSIEEATITLSPWEKLVAVAFPGSVDEGTTIGSSGGQAPTQTWIPDEAPPVAEAPEPVAAPVAAPEETVDAAASMPEAADAPPVAQTEPAAPDVAPSIAELEQPVADASAAPDAATTPNPPSGTASGIRTSAMELPVAPQAPPSTKSGPIATLRDTLEREWRDAKPILEQAAAPVKESISLLPRWMFKFIAGFAVVIAIAWWIIANRPVATSPPEPTITKVPEVKPIPAPPLPTLDQLLLTGTEAAKRGDPAALSKVWQELQKRFPDPKWRGHNSSAAFISATAQAWQDDKLGDPVQAARGFLPILTTASKGNAALLAKLSTTFHADARTAEPFELALLDTLSGDPAQSERLLDESLRLLQLRTSGKVAARARDLIRQKLEPLVSFRERNPRPDDVNAALRNALAALAPKLAALAATEEPSALYLHADKLRMDGRVADAIPFFEKAAMRDHAPSMLQLGLALSNLPDKATAMPRAVHWFRMGDEKGYVQATYALGDCLLYGKGVPRDYAQALRCLEAAAASDISTAHFMLGNTYLGFAPPLPPGDDFNAAKFNPALTGAARMVKAREHLEKALLLGDAQANSRLANLLIEGVGGPRDLGRGVRLLDAASKLETPDPAVLRNLAYLLMPELLEGVPFSRADLDAAGVRPDAARAQQLMVQAARLNDTPAQDWCRSAGVTY